LEKLNLFPGWKGAEGGGEIELLFIKNNYNGH